MTKEKGSLKRKYTTITIPTPLFERIRLSIKDTGFSSVSDYATYILRDTTAKLNSAKGGKSKKSKEEDEVISKLRALGYI